MSIPCFNTALELGFYLPHRWHDHIAKLNHPLAARISFDHGKGYKINSLKSYQGNINC